MLEINADTLAMFLVTSTWCEVSRDPADFIRTYDDNFDGDPRHFAEIIVVDEFDCPDDLYAIFNIGEHDEARLDALFDLKHADRVHDLVTEYLELFRAIAPTLIPPPTE